MEDDTHDRVWSIREWRASASSHQADVVIIDGLGRRQLEDVALERVEGGGVVDLDNSASSESRDQMEGRGLGRVDFYELAPRVARRHYTSSCTRGILGCSAMTARRSPSSTAGESARLHSNQCAASQALSDLTVARRMRMRLPP